MAVGAPGERTPKIKFLLAKVVPRHGLSTDGWHANHVPTCLIHRNMVIEPCGT